MSKFLFEELAFSDKYNQSAPKRMILGISLFVCLLLIGYLVDLRNLQHNLFEQRDKNAVIQHQLTQLEQQTADISLQRTQLKQLQLQFNSLHQEMPVNSNSQLLINHILQAAQASSVQLSSIKPQALQQQDFYEILPINVTATGNYPQFIDFIKLLNQLNVLMTFPDFTLTHTNPRLSTAMDSAPSNSDKLMMNMTINVYLSR